MDINGEKRELRKAVREKLRALSAEDRTLAARQVLEKLSGFDRWNSAGLVLAFVSLPDEIDTAPILRAALEAGKILAVPRVAGENLTFYKISNLEHDIAPGAFGIGEPLSDLPPVAPESLSELSCVALVPGVAFDRENFRLGRGKGFYDRFFASGGNSVYKIGIGYSFQLVEKVPREPHDQKLDTVIVSGSSASLCNA